jgi:hypothetical protein
MEMFQHALTIVLIFKHIRLVNRPRFVPCAQMFSLTDGTGCAKLSLLLPILQGEHKLCLLLPEVQCEQNVSLLLPILQSEHKLCFLLV